MLYWCKISASYIILSVKEELLSVPGCGHTHTPVKTVLLKMQILLALEPLKGWVNDTCLGVNKEHCNSRLVSDLDITHFYNDSKISSLKGTHFWIFFFFNLLYQACLYFKRLGFHSQQYTSACAILAHVLLPFCHQYMPSKTLFFLFNWKSLTLVSTLLWNFWSKLWIHLW